LFSVSAIIDESQESLKIRGIYIDLKKHWALAKTGDENHLKS
jgi:hypothetical protein